MRLTGFCVSFPSVASEQAIVQQLTPHWFRIKPLRLRIRLDPCNIAKHLQAREQFKHETQHTKEKINLQHYETSQTLEEPFSEKITFLDKCTFLEDQTAIHTNIFSNTYSSRRLKNVSGNTKDKIAVRNNAGKTTPAATVPMANAYANAKFLRKSKTLPRLFATGSAMKRARDFSF
ncbi:hypothetical protein DY000_02039537 [Brassica cretica]|uniref:TPX2 central domain-containing protein n=1 Tax=Brassica cretica TaxID=69181 RepID=A0ABQ7BNN1_BRACR|nr:hypothetical protein DY000_02039537 [Brassica cretica]